MSKSLRLVQFFISGIVIFMMTFSGFRLTAAQAQSGDGLKRQWNVRSGRISFIGPETGRTVSAAKALGTFLRPQDPGLALAKRFAPEFGIQNPERDLSERQVNKSPDGRLTFRYQQNDQGIPVIGAELIVNTNENGDLYSMNGEVSSGLSLPAARQPKVDSASAGQIALQAVATLYQKTPADLLVSTPELWIYDESLLRPSTAPAELVWRMEVTAQDTSLPIRELVLVNAWRGNISLHFNQIDAEWQGREKFAPAFDSARASTSSTFRGSQSLEGSPAPALLPTLLASTYTANNTSSLPGTFLCNQTDPGCSPGDVDARAAHRYAMGTSDFYATRFGRNSIDNNGMTIVSTVHYCDSEDPFLGCPYANAFWSGTQMVYGDAYGFALADDVVAHELSHGVTQHESNLFYYYQAGAINESFSDVFGEYYDQINGQGSDEPKDLWLIGEDISGIGAIRSMIDPPAFDNPDKMSSPLYYKDDGDNGGVHYNSGINNKAVFLMVGGGTFNGKTITALGWEKVGAIYYEVNVNLLTSGADYSDLYYALQQACTNLMGQHGITAGDCTQIKNAADAVEMNGQPEPGFNTDAPLCDAGNQVNTAFYDSLENGLSNWTFDNGANPRWQIDSPDGAYARSGLHSLFANGVPAGVTDTTARLAPILIPPNGYLHFAQAYGFSSLGPGYYFDGGVLEYSTNGGSTWLDAGPLMDTNGYDDTIFADFGNPLAGRSGFVGASHGYISTRLNLSSLAGQSVTFRWRMGLGDFDFFGSTWGWWLDDIRVYNCGVPTSWMGGVSISSDKNVVAVGRLHIGEEIASYGSFASGSLTAYVPMLFKDAFGSYDSALYVQNVHASNTANITIKYYDSSGILSCTKADTIAPLSSKGYWVPSAACDTGSLPAGWAGGVVVTSNQPIVAVGRPHIGGEIMTYNGFASGSLTTYIPMLFKGAFGGSYNAAFYLQNVHASNTASVTIKYYDSNGVLNCTKADTIAPLASKGYWVPAATCDTGSLPDGWVGGVVVTSNQPLAGVGRPHIGTQITTYNGFPAGSLSSYVPMLFKGTFGSYDSAFYVQNVHTSNTASITIQYYDSSGTLNCTKTDTIAPLASKGYWLPSATCNSGSVPAGWMGSVVVTSNQPIVTVGRPHIGTQVATYNGFTSGNLNAYLPMLFKAAFGGSYNAAFYIQNTDSSTANVTIKFYDTDGHLSCTRTDSIPARATLGYWVPGVMCSP